MLSGKATYVKLPANILQYTCLADCIDIARLSLEWIGLNTQQADILGFSSCHRHLRERKISSKAFTSLSSCTWLVPCASGIKDDAIALMLVIERVFRPGLFTSSAEGIKPAL